MIFPSSEEETMAKSILGLIKNIKSKDFFPQGKLYFFKNKEIDDIDTLFRNGGFADPNSQFTKFIDHIIHLFNSSTDPETANLALGLIVRYFSTYAELLRNLGKTVFIKTLVDYDDFKEYKRLLYDLNTEFTCFTELQKFDESQAAVPKILKILSKLLRAFYKHAEDQEEGSVDVQWRYIYIYIYIYSPTMNVHKKVQNLFRNLKIHKIILKFLKDNAAYYVHLRNQNVEIVEDNSPMGAAETAKNDARNSYKRGSTFTVKDLAGKSKSKFMDSGMEGRAVHAEIKFTDPSKLQKELLDDDEIPIELIEGEKGILQIFEVCFQILFFFCKENPNNKMYLYCYKNITLVFYGMRKNSSYSQN